MAGIITTLNRVADRALQRALGVDAAADVREATDPRFGDYQVNGVLPLARVLKDNPRKLAQRVVDVWDDVLAEEGLGDLCEPPEVAGPGFINLRLRAGWLGAEVGRRAADEERLGLVPTDEPLKTVIDFSSPNVAKRMHVGHLRSTIIGDALARVLRLLGHEVIGDNHVGDWGTQFGILIWAYRHHADHEALERDPVAELERLYKLGSEASRADEAVADACRAELAKLQAGDPDNRALWERFVAISRADAERIYDRLGVRFDSWRGESAYHDDLPRVIDELLAKGLARESEGALVVFFPEDDPELADRPFLVRKSDGAYLYSTTDIATLEYRVSQEGAQRIIYVVDIRQSLHFKQLFRTAQLMGYDVRLEHVGFGMMLGADGRPFRTRDGGTVSLESLLDEAQARILPKVVERWPDASEEEQRDIAARVGIGAVKYADLNQNLATDYKFDWDKLLAADGDTGPYLQYTLVRIRSVLREHEARFGEAFAVDGSAVTLEAPEERALAAYLLKFDDVLERVGELLKPHILCEYLYGLARAYNPFYAKCPILGAEDEALRRSRLTLCAATARTLELGLGALNLPLLDRM